MSDSTITVSQVSWQEFENRVQKILIISDQLDILAFELRQMSFFLKNATQKIRLEGQA
ncbi:hypothetical protein QM565_19290 [Geitlerinema splendidum]|nr:hypothetical protein [Geitlerinema splendidum]